MNPGSALKMLLVAAALFAASSAAIASDAETFGAAELRSRSLEELMDVKITTTTTVPEALDRTTSSVTVLTREDIVGSGARDLYDVLDMVPGVRAGLSYLGQNTIAVRGMKTTSSVHVLFMVDGEPLNSARTGSATADFLDQLPLANVERVEVVRGTGSALYGANAFLAVVNVIRRDPTATEQPELWVSHEVESAGTVGQRYELLWGERRDDATLEVQVGLGRLDGAELRVDADALGRPGIANSAEDHLDVQVRGRKGGLSFDARFFERDAGDQFGVLSVLGGDSRQQTRLGTLGLRWSRPWGDTVTLHLSGRLSRIRIENDYEGLPAGAIPPGHPFEAWNTTGLRGSPRSAEDVVDLGLRAAWTPRDDHTVVVGTELRYDDLHDVRYLANYDPSPLPQVEDVSDRFNWMDEAERTVMAVYAQDVWDISDTWRFVAGARWDEYSDFGTTVNPRLGVSWLVRDGLTMRSSYGRAFRAPDFVSQRVKNNPAVLGNPDLDPESVETWQASADLRRERLFCSATWFESQAEDLIRSLADGDMYENVGSFHAHGVEGTLRYRLVDGLDLGGSYAWVEATDGDGRAYRDYPPHAGAVWLGARARSGVTARLFGSWQGETPRTPEDPRDPVEGRILTNLDFGAPLGASGLELKVSVFNLFDVDYAHPAAEDPIPGDYTAPSRSLVVGLRALR